MTAISISRLDKRYGSHQVLRDIDLVVKDQSTTAVLGASGSGKTTLLRLIAGFDRADSGAIMIGDTIVDDDTTFVRAQHRAIGYVAQDAALFPHLSVASNIGFGVARSDRKEVDRLIELVGLAGLERRMPHQLSGGQQQRVALARALAIHPDLVLLDEPFGSLDAGLRESLRRDVARVLEQMGATTILVTHDQNEALSFADTIAVLRDGQIVAQQSPEQLYRKPPDMATAAFIGESNILPGRAEPGFVNCLLGRLTSNGGPVSGPCDVLIRPEQLHIRVDVSRHPGDVIGVIREMRFHGHELIVTIDISGTTVLARVRSSEDLSIGASVVVETVGSAVSWDSADSQSGDVSEH